MKINNSFESSPMIDISRQWRFIIFLFVFKVASLFSDT